MPNWKDTKSHPDAGGSRFAYCFTTPEFIQNLDCFCKSGLQKLVRQPLISKRHTVFDKETFNADIFRNRELDNLEILVLSHLWGSEILDGMECYENAFCT